MTRIEGTQPGSHGRLNLHNFNLAKKVLKSGDVGVGEAYMDGDWSSPDVTAFLLVFCQNSEILIARRRNFFSKVALSFIAWRDQNTKKGSKRNIATHYDLGNDFYSRWLDPSMTYSSAIFEKPGMSLEDAQEAKYANLVRETGIGPNDHVLEIGCGWGGFAEFAAKEIGCKVTGLTISQEQLNFAQERIQKAGLSDKVDLVFRDYRDETTQYDKIASIEMFEAVGEKYWPTYFDQLKTCLKPGGSAGLQIITIREEMFDKYRASTDFIQRYIFPGGMLPTPEILEKLGEERQFKLVGERVFGHDYADTLAVWRDKFREAWPDVKPMGFDERFKRMWEFYMHYCEAGFRSENIDVRQMVFQKA